MNKEAVKLQVCITCLGEDKERVGEVFYEEVKNRLDGKNIELESVECFAVCKRPATVAVSQPEKWLYMIGDLKIGDIDDLFAYIDSYRNSESGTPPLSERPAVIRKGVIARLPNNKNS
ncbi:MAG: DUF1636 domain-containing protein [Rickettsiales bacterium]